MELRPGMYLQGDKYRIIKVLGNGGFGITYLAEHELAGRNVCIKEFFPKEYYNRTSDSHNVSLGSQGSAEMMDAYKAKFIKEAKTIARLDHPNIIHIHDVFAENNTAYYVMEYIEGESLSDVVRKGGALKEEEAVEYIRIIASAIGYIHEQRIMHLDIKPANIMLRKRDNRAILIDFGLSKQYDGDGHQTSSTPVGISAGYAPMEQYQQGGVKEFSPETDIYSLGATLYTLVTGAIPPQAAIIADEGFPELPSHLSAGVRRAIETSMLIQRRRRPHSIEEFLALLDNNVAAAPMPGDGEATILPPQQPLTPPSEDTIITPPVKEQPKVEPRKAEQPKPTPTPTTPKQRSKWWLWLLLLLVAVGSAVGYMMSGGDEPEPIQTSSTASPTIDIGGYYAVDLGLSVKWATCNVGATRPEDYGNYYAWGETSPKTSYTMDNCKTMDESTDDIDGDSYYDAATANWGSVWRLPTKSEFQELRDNCSWTWTKLNGVNGYEVKSKKNGNSIFLPAAGYCDGGTPSLRGSSGSYWSSTPYGTYCASFLNFFSGGRDMNSSYPYYGLSVRPVSE